MSKRQRFESPFQYFKYAFYTLAIAFCIIVIFNNDPMSIGRVETVKQGRLDLSDWNIDELSSININGRWELYDGRLLGPEDFATTEQMPKIDTYLPLGDAFPGFFGLAQTNGLYTYRLTVLMPEDDRPLGFMFTDMNMATKVYVNGREIGGSGVVAPEGEGYRRLPIPFETYFTNDRAEMEVIVQVANHDYYSPGSQIKLQIGTQEDIMAKHVRNSTLSASAVLLTLVLAIFSLVLYSAKVQESSLLIFSMIYVSLSVMFVLIGPHYIYSFIPNLPYRIASSLRITASASSFLMIFLYMRTVEPQIISKRFLIYTSATYGVYVILCWLIPFRYVVLTGLPFYLISIVITFIITVRSIYYLYLRRDAKRELLLTGWHVLLIASLFMTTLNAILLSLNAVYSTSAGEIAFLCIIISGYMIVARRFVSSFRHTLVADQMRDEILMKTQYELRTPIEAIIRLSKQDSLDDTRDRQEEIQELAEHMLQSLESYWTYALLNNEQLQLSREMVQVSVVVDVVMESVRVNYPDSRIEYKNNVSKRDFVWADPNRLRQILYILALNAVQNTKEGTLSFSTIVARNMLEIHIQDTGAGIELVDRERIFEPYVSLGGSGVGLGLPIAKSLSRHLSGRLELFTSEVGVGSTFVLTLPDASSEASFLPDIAPALSLISNRFMRGDTRPDRHQEAPMRPIDRTHPTAAYSDLSRRGQGRIILLDRDFYALTNTALTLKEAGFHVVKLQNPSKLIELIQEEVPDLLILDFSLMNWSGLDVTRSVREHWSLLELPILMTSLGRSSEDLRLALDAGANDHLPKPFDSWTLVNRIDSLMNLKAAMSHAVSSELAFLQAQVKPHFIFNAISTISYFCYTDAMRAAELLNQFSHYLRLSFDVDPRRDMVSLRRELALVRAYYEIERARFGEKIVFYQEVEEGLEDLEVPVLSVQPLVENAIKHGLLRTDEGGYVRVRVKRSDDEHVEIAVSDNGEGMDSETLAMLLEPDSDEIVLSETSTRAIGQASARHLNSQRTAAGVERRHVGFRNIKRRIERLPDASILVRSREKQGTEVLIRFRHR